MTAQPPLPMVPVAGVIPVGVAAALVEDGDGGRVFVHGQLFYAWAADDVALRRLAAVKLVEHKVAAVSQVCAAFGVGTVTLWRWRAVLGEQGVAGLVPGKRGPKGPSRLTPEVVADIAVRRKEGATLAQIGDALSMAPNTARRALQPPAEETAQAPEAAAADPDQDTGLDQDADAADAQLLAGGDDTAGGEPQLPLLGDPAPRHGERALAAAGLLSQADPVFTPAGRVPLAGLFLALPALQATGLLACAKDVYGALPAGFYGLDTMLTEGVFRALIGEARAEGATRIDPIALGRVLGLDRAPEVKTIRRKLTHLATQGKATGLLEAMATRHLARTTTSAGTAGDDRDGGPGVVLYVDGHVRAYQGSRRVAKTHLSRLRFPAPATVETWVADAAGDPVLVVMSQPGASLAGELRDLLPTLRTAVGDDRRVLVGFDRGGWSPTLFVHMDGAGFDVLTWRKGRTQDVTAENFAEATFVDENRREHTWTLADTTVNLPLDTKNEQGEDETFTMRQITRIDDKLGVAKQLHILTTRTDLSPGEVVYRMGSRWRQENYFRYARMHFDLDSHDSYATTVDDPERLVPNPAKKKAYQVVTATRARYERAVASTDAALLAARSPRPGHHVVISNTEHDRLTENLRAAEAELTAAQAAHKELPVRVRLGDLHPGQQVLDTQTKLLHHCIRIAAFNTATTIARAIRIHTTYARANHEAHTLARQILTATGDIDPTVDGVLTIRLDPLPTARASAAAAELCEHLNATNTTYPGTDLTMRYEVKTRP